MFYVYAYHTIPQQKEEQENKTYGMVWCMVWNDMAWCGMVWYGMVWCGLVWHGVVCHPTEIAVCLDRPPTRAPEILFGAIDR